MIDPVFAMCVQAEQAQAAAGADSGQVWRAAARSLNLDDAQKQA